MEHARFVMGRPQIKFLAILVGAFFLILAAFTVSAQQSSEAQFRVKNENAFNINLIQFKRTEYVGPCAGTVFSPDSQSARFVSSKTPPGPNRRVMIKNVTDGMETNPYPYTDRGYNKGEFSEDFGFKLGNSHKTRTFSVLEGENKFIYEIKENITISATWVYGTGQAVTLPLAAYAINAHTPQFNQMISSLNGVTGIGTQAQDYGEKNSFRMAPYHRLDIAAQFRKKLKRSERTIEVGVYNAYNRYNPFFYYTTTDINNNAKLMQVSLFPLLPSISWNYKF